MTSINAANSLSNSSEIPVDVLNQLQSVVSNDPKQIAQLLSLLSTMTSVIKESSSGATAGAKAASQPTDATTPAGLQVPDESEILDQELAVSVILSTMGNLNIENAEFQGDVQKTIGQASIKAAQLDLKHAENVLKKYIKNEHRDPILNFFKKVFAVIAAAALTALGQPELACVLLATMLLTKPVTDGVSDLLQAMGVPKNVADEIAAVVTTVTTAVVSGGLSGAGVAGDVEAVAKDVEATVSDAEKTEQFAKATFGDLIKGDTPAAIENAGKTVEYAEKTVQAAEKTVTDAEALKLDVNVVNDIKSTKTDAEKTLKTARETLEALQNGDIDVGFQGAHDTIIDAENTVKDARSTLRDVRGIVDNGASNSGVFKKYMGLFKGLSKPTNVALFAGAQAMMNTNALGGLAAFIPAGKARDIVAGCLGAVQILLTLGVGIGAGGAVISQTERAVSLLQVKTAMYVQRAAQAAEGGVSFLSGANTILQGINQSEITRSLTLENLAMAQSSANNSSATQSLKTITNAMSQNGQMQNQFAAGLERGFEAMTAMIQA